MKSINLNNLWFVMDENWKNDGYIFYFPDNVYVSYVDACFDCLENMVVVSFQDVKERIFKDIHEDS